MKAIELLDRLKGMADQYSKEAQRSLVRNGHMNEIEEGEVVQQRHIDAVIVDYINFIAMRHAIDYALYTKDLKK